jgi:hypothetical protein
VLFYPPDPGSGSGMEQWSDPDPGSGIKHPGSATLHVGLIYAQCLKSKFKVQGKTPV